jgi:hypothetical protein
MYITVTDDEGIILDRWYIGDEITIVDVEEALNKKFVLAFDKEDFDFLTS